MFRYAILYTDLHSSRRCMNCFACPITAECIVLISWGCSGWTRCSLRRRSCKIQHSEHTWQHWIESNLNYFWWIRLSLIVLVYQRLWESRLGMGM